jgi:transposase InsO family protein
MRFAFIDAEKTFYPVVVLCRVLEVSTSGFYAWRLRPDSTHAKEDARLKVEVAAAHKRGRCTYGSPRVHSELRAQGTRIARKRVARLMKEQGLRARQKRRFRKTTDSNHEDPIADNILDREFTQAGPNLAWVTDVTYIWTLTGWLYLAVVLDLFSRRVVGWSASEHNDGALAQQALGDALAKRRFAPGLVHHSDRGSPYASAAYRALLVRHDIVASMSEKGDCWDNAVAESFFATLKAEHVELQQFTCPTAAISSIGDYIEGFYNPIRRHSHLGYMSPIEFELKAQMAAQAA